MVNIVLTTDVKLNGCILDVQVTEYRSDGTTAKDFKRIDDGTNSYILDGESYTSRGFIGQNDVTEYSVFFELITDDPTKSPVVHSSSIDIPSVPYKTSGIPTTVNAVTNISKTTAESTVVPRTTQSFGRPQTTHTYAQSDVGSNTTNTVGTPLTTDSVYSQLDVGTQSSTVMSDTATDGFTQTYDSPKTTTVVGDTNQSYVWVEENVSTSGPTAVASTGIATAPISKIGPYDELLNANINKVSDSWSNNAIPFGPNRNIWKLANAFCAPLDGIDYRLNKVHANIHVPFAMGQSLDRIGNLANVTRKTGESDDHYRQRIIVYMRASVIGTTYNEVVSFTATLLNQPVDEIVVDLRPQEFPATLFVLVNENDVEDLPFDLQEIADLIDMVVPADHNVVLELQGTFLFKKIGEPDEPEHGFTTLPASDTVGGTLAGEIGE